MKKNLRLWLGIGFAALMCALFASIFVSYSKPMKAEHYDLSLTLTMDEVTMLDKSAERGWTVFTQEGTEVTILEPDGIGGFPGLAYAGQTFYFSRVMTEQLDAATLQLGTANRSFAVFLDGTLIYTDCPDADNRIGYLTLASREWDRVDDITIALPDGYAGKTLTIAQSTSIYAETPRMATIAVPASVNLYCGYAYESSLIAESFQTAVSGAIGYLLGAMVVIFFVRQLTLGRFDWGLACLALTIFLIMAADMYETSYSLRYFGDTGFLSTSSLCLCVAEFSFLGFLISRAGRLRWVAAVITLLGVVNFIFFLLLGSQPFYLTFLVWSLPFLLTLLALASALILGAVFWRKENRFYRWFAPLSGLFILAYLVVRLILPTRGQFLATLLTIFKTLTFLDFTQHLTMLLSGLALILVTVMFFRDEINRVMEKRLMLERGEMVQQRYENLRLHNEEVMMLRHDMQRHFHLLRQMTTDEKTAQYLDELIGQSANIRPVINTGNEMLDIILGSRLSEAQDKGVKVEVVRSSAPEKLSLSDADLCSLVMNLMDNAVTAASTCGQEEPYIRLDLHIKNSFFVFVCENAARLESINTEDEEKTVPKHGLGRRIVRQIADKNGVLLQTEYGKDHYKVSLAFPLGHPSK